MSLEMVIEADDKLKLDEVRSALTACGAKMVEPKNVLMEASFAESYMSCYVRSHGGHRNIFTMGTETLGWSVGMRLTFRYRGEKYNEARADLRCFVYKLCDVTEARFVLSFQTETLYAIRDASGIKVIQPF